MNLLWAFELKKATDPITKRSIPVDINNYSTVGSVFVLFL